MKTSAFSIIVACLLVSSSALEEPRLQSQWSIPKGSETPLPVNSQGGVQDQLNRLVDRCLAAPENQSGLKKKPSMTPFYRQSY
jgi:hypothetical protein